MHKRGPNDIWENLYEFPLFETPGEVDPEQMVSSRKFRDAFGGHTRISFIHGPVKHLLSHQKIHAMFIGVENFSDDTAAQKDWFYADYEALEEFAQPKLIFAYLKNLFKLKSNLYPL